MTVSDEVLYELMQENLAVEIEGGCETRAGAQEGGEVFFQLFRGSRQISRFYGGGSVGGSIVCYLMLDFHYEQSYNSIINSTVDNRPVDKEANGSVHWKKS